MPLGSESSVALDQLDSHTKAILRLKLRAFVHLHPCFDTIATINTNAYVLEKSAVDPYAIAASISSPAFNPSGLNWPKYEERQEQTLQTSQSSQSSQSSYESSDAHSQDELTCPNRPAQQRAKRRILRLAGL